MTQCWNLYTSIGRLVGRSVDNSYEPGVFLLQTKIIIHSKRCQWQEIIKALLRDRLASHCRHWSHTVNKHIVLFVEFFSIWSVRYWYLWCHFYRIPITLKPRCFFSFSFFSTQSPLYFILPTHLFRCDVLRIKLVSDFFCFNVAEGGKKLATTTLRIEANLIDDADDILVIFRFTIEFIAFSASFCFEWRKSMKMINDDDIDFFGFCCLFFFSTLLSVFSLL